MTEKKVIKIALAGNPNCGKTSIFNAITGLRQKVGNFAGVTVDKKTGILRTEDKEFTIVDLPGTYSIYPRRIDEMVTFDVLANPDNPLHPDLVVLVADASNLKRNLLFCTQVIDLGIPTVIALNMIDVAQKNNLDINLSNFEKEMGVPVVAMNARDGQGISELIKKISGMIENPKSKFLDIDKLVTNTSQIREKIAYTNGYTAVLFAVLHHDLIDFPEGENEFLNEWKSENQFNPSKFQAAEVTERYRSVNAIISSCIKVRNDENNLLRNTSKIDKILLHKIWGYIILAAVFFFVFQSIFTIAQYPMDIISNGFSETGNLLHRLLPAGVISDLLVQGIWAGIGGVVVFIPQIMLLFGFITILEDSGYMARVSFLMDRIMRMAGLSGKSTVPLISGMACAIPAIMSTRNIENWKDRIITIMVVPFMSCSARLPVYTLLVSFVVPDQTILGIFNARGLWMLGFYVLGFLVAVAVSLILKLLISAREKSFLLMEMPIYRWPRWGNVGITMLEKAKVFVSDAGKIIVAISVVLWFLASYGPGSKMQEVEKKYSAPAFSSNYSKDELQFLKQSEKLKNSYAGHIGQFIEPVITPLGFDWKIGISLITAFAAREIFVGTMATIYSVGSEDELNLQSLRARMKREVLPVSGKPVYSYATIISLMLFFALAMQCISTIAVVKRETKGWKWPIIQLSFMTLTAYTVSFVVYQVLK